MLRNLVLIILGGASVFTGLTASGVDEPEFLYLKAMEMYEGERYEDAQTLLEEAVTAMPDEPRYHHLLGKCYGRMAEQANALRALSLARKTRSHFEKAVELDDENIPALTDLMEYYRQAPGFLGGSRKKAAEIEKKITRIKTLHREDGSRPPRESHDLPATM